MAKVFIGVGHGGKDSGAVAGGLRESDVNLTMALAMRDELRRHGVTVGISRTTDEDDRLSEEIQECNAFSPDLAVEVHNNSGGGDGFEVFLYPGSGQARRLAEAIEDEVKGIGQNSRGIKTSTALGWVREVKAPAVLCEGFFLDNAADRLIADTAAKQRAFGAAYARGVLRVLGIAYRGDAENQAGASVDNTPDGYAADAVGKAIAKGVIRGDDRGDMSLHEAVTRQDLCVMLERCGII